MFLFVSVHMALSEHCLHGSDIGRAHNILSLMHVNLFVVHCQDFFLAFLSDLHACQVCRSEYVY